MAAHSLYSTRVMHRRFGAKSYRFVYRTFCLLLDIDALDALPRFLSRNRFNLFSFYDRDHGARQHDISLRQWTQNLLAEHAVDLAGGRIRLLCMPRVLGYGFNPISLWYCEHADGLLRAVIIEVRNTFGEKHQYVIHNQGQSLDITEPREADKVFHVSPFINMDARYVFKLREPGDYLRVLIDEYDDNQNPLLTASLSGRQRPCSGAQLLWQFCRVPFLSVKVIFLIHWHALKLFARGLRIYCKPPKPNAEVSETWRYENK
ncbi:MAG TPA: DUF1365 domain-containing protein [Gammaproteobacteria bacterium]|nr:DUF1365 domain-containing protein [Gammaproteobacteria bacterium]